MIRGSPAGSLVTLPEALPIFPLAGALLLPRGRLPLNVFEPRYLNMVEAALATPMRMIGMVQTREPADEPGPVADDATVYEVGCAGRIAAFSETDDGRYLITLLGVIRYRIARELEPERGFRRVVPDFGPFDADLREPNEDIGERGALMATVRRYFQLKSITADWKAVEQAPDEAIVTTLAMMCPFEAREKQALLETSGLAERATLLASLMEMELRAAEATAPETPQ